MPFAAKGVFPQLMYLREYNQMQSQNYSYERFNELCNWIQAQFFRGASFETNSEAPAGGDVGLRQFYRDAVFTIGSATLPGTYKPSSVANNADVPGFCIDLCATYTGLITTSSYTRILAFICSENNAYDRIYLQIVQKTAGVAVEAIQGASELTDLMGNRTTVATICSLTDITFVDTIPLSFGPASTANNALLPNIWISIPTTQKQNILNPQTAIVQSGVSQMGANVPAVYTAPLSKTYTADAVNQV